MPTKDDRRAALLVLALIAAGSAVRMVGGGAGAPGAVAYRAGDGTRVARDSVTARASRLARPLGRNERMDVDRATAEELTRLPRIGPALAARIVAEREARGPFGSLEGLRRVSGMGPATLEGLRRHTAFSGIARPEASDGLAGAARGVARARRSDDGGGRGAPGGDESPLHLNRATAEELDGLPGIGPALAGAIVEDRSRHGPYRTVEDLTRVPGIGPKTVERLRGRVKVP